MIANKRLARYRSPAERASASSHADPPGALRDTGDFTTDAAAADDLLRQYRKQHGFSRVAAGRGLQLGDTLVMDLEVSRRGPGGEGGGRRRWRRKVHLVRRFAGVGRTGGVWVGADVAHGVGSAVAARD